MPRRLIVYDLDGTLVDTLEDITQAANHMLEQLGRPGVSAQVIRGYIGRGLAQLVRACVQTDDPAQLAHATIVYRAYYTQHLLDHTRLYPDARAACEFFRLKRQAVITNKPDPYSRNILTALGLAPFFCDIIAGDERYPKKPDPTSLRALMLTEGVSGQETVFVGDSPIDIETGRRAGVFTVAVTHGFTDAQELTAAKPDLLVENFTGLIETAQRQRW